KSNLKVPVAPQSLPSPLRGHIQFQDVSFSYPSRPHQKVLEDVSFEVFKGEILALTGHSGAGKTTIFNLLMRFYDPLSGQIFLDGAPLENLDPRELRSVIGVVPQDPVLFSTTFFENIRFGNLNASEEEVKAAAKAAYADEFIEPLSDGYQTYLGEKGVTLSGGQRQRIAIARAILKNAPILLLDEATSALDTESEQKVQKALAALKQDRTTLLIAHRESTIETADRVINLSNGRISGAV
ncbi:MAG: ATP-binding cassette domain-containing protein, partial [Alphaproteobacteria bacterium]|nr:ATP-binding cassette domain-containing protein [Alphaproteobacteria bacterium]